MIEQFLFLRSATSLSRNWDDKNMRSLLTSLSRATTLSTKSFQKGLHQQQQNLSIFDSVCLRCRRQQLQFLQRQQRNFNVGSRRLHQQPADDPQWISPIDRPSQIVRVGRRHGPGLILLGKPPPPPSSTYKPLA